MPKLGITLEGLNAPRKLVGSPPPVLLGNRSGWVAHALFAVAFTAVYLLALGRYPVLSDALASIVVAADLLDDHPLT